MRIPFFRTSLAIALATASTYSLANGLAINEQSASSAGTAYAGRASSALDASTIFGNPAGLSKLEGNQIVGGLALVKATVDIKQKGGTAKGRNKGDMVPVATVPFGYFSSQINENWSAGVGIYVPFGVISDYEKDFAGRSHGLKSSVNVITFQPTIAYKFNDIVSVGFGPTLNRIEGELTNSLNTSGLAGGQLANGDSKVKIKGDDIAYGFNAGVMVNITPDTTWGLTYHSKVKYKLSGDIKYEIDGKLANGPLGAFLPNGKHKATLDITMPEMIDTSITHRLDDKWTLHGGVTYTRWSRLKSIEAKPKNGGPIVGEELEWSDTWAWSLGASYQLNPQVVLRTGFAWDKSPTNTEYRNVRIPVSDRKIFTLGAGWSPTNDLTFDFAYAYIKENKGKVDRPDQKPVNAPGMGNIGYLQPGYKATYRNSAHGFTAQATYKF
ncbi:outer membrane protein transport protein [Pseudomonas sp. F1_0610]|uniref:OmpP1/FadL family transporter n=1 Tax=Pseudomonas sp. F1_0610 TaxID=3114284 RepID=UPI0039C04A21